MYIGQTQQLIFFIIDTDGSSNGGLFVADPNLNISYWQGYNYIASPEREPAEDFGFGLYKLSVMNKYIYLDWRDIRYGSYNYCNGHCADIYVKYDGLDGNLYVKNKADFIWGPPISNGNYLSIWELKNQGVPLTGDAPNYWQNCLVVIPSQTGNHPRLVWGPYPSSSIAVEAYKVYRKIGSSSFAPCTTLSASTYQFTDESVYLSIPGGQAGTDVQYKVTAIYSTNNETSSTNTVTLNIQGDEIEKRSYSIPITAYNYNLEQSYPNPFNPNTKINYSINQAGFVTLKVFNVLGKEVAMLVNEMKEAGYHSSEFNASNLPSGVYLYTLEVSGFISSKKMLLMK